MSDDNQDDGTELTLKPGAPSRAELIKMLKQKSSGSSRAKLKQLLMDDYGLTEEEAEELLNAADIPENSRDDGPGF